MNPILGYLIAILMMVIVGIVGAGLWLVSTEEKPTPDAITIKMSFAVAQSDVVRLSPKKALFLTRKGNWRIANIRQIEQLGRVGIMHLDNNGNRFARYCTV
jgi:hypothetical protein